MEQLPHTSDGKKYKLHIEKAVARGQGSRTHQEDTFSIYDKHLNERGYGIYSIFDGHGTDKFSIHASQNLAPILEKTEEFQNHDYVNSLRRAFYEENNAMLPEYKNGEIGGTTATVALIADGDLYLANVGDSRSVICIKDNNEEKAVRLSKDHSFSDKEEKKRIIKSGGDVYHGRVRNNGHGINMTRALGDFDFKTPFNNAKLDFISSEPHIKSIALSPEDSFLVIASDGLWGVVEDQELVDIIVKRRREGDSVEQITASIVSSVCHLEGSDNVTVMLLLFEWQELPHTETSQIDVDPLMTKKLVSDKDVELYAPVTIK